MSQGRLEAGVAAGRLTPEEYASNFADLHPPLDGHEARVAADRCYFCYDAPCVTACPTGIDIPLFIRQIATGNTLGSAKTIFDQNILGGMCARVCPTETLCEQACVRETAEGKPVEIGRLQRFATDAAMTAGKQFYARAERSGKLVAVVGAGPAGLACAHRLAMHGHEVTVFDARPKAGGLNEYGIAAYKAVDGFAQAEVDYVTAIGGINIEYGKALGAEIDLAGLCTSYDAVFLGLGLGGVNALGADGDHAAGGADAVDWIADLDAAVQAKLLGAEEVTICYRRGRENMNASGFEQDLATSKGVTIRHWLQPKRVLVEGGKVSGIELEYTAMQGGKLAGTGETLTLAADQVFRAIGQSFVAEPLAGGVALERGRIKADAEGRTSMPKVWAGGDCVAGGDDLTVSAVAAGRDAAESIHRALS